VTGFGVSHARGALNLLGALKLFIARQQRLVVALVHVGLGV